MCKVQNKNAKINICIETTAEKNGVNANENAKPAISN